MTLIYIHLASVLPAAVLGGFLFAARKGTPRHRMIGKVYMLLMLATAITTLFMPAIVGPRLFNHFGFIHSFSALALWTLPTAYFAARRGDIIAHMRAMRGLYIGGILIAGALAFTPGRVLYVWFFG